MSIVFLKKVEKTWFIFSKQKLYKMCLTLQLIYDKIKMLARCLRPLIQSIRPARDEVRRIFMAENEENRYTLVDEDGVEQSFEMLDMMEVDGKQYFAMMPIYEDPQKQLESDGELVVLTFETVDGEEYLSSIDDDDEYERIGNLFIERLNEMFEDEDEEEDE